MSLYKEWTDMVIDYVKLKEKLHFGKNTVQSRKMFIPKY